MDDFAIFRNITIIFAASMLIKYVLYLLIAPFYKVKEYQRRYRLLSQNKKAYLIYKPLVSVIVPAWNEEVGIIRTIESVLTNNYDAIELIVVDDGSIDNTALKVSEYIKKYKKTAISKLRKIRFYSKVNQGKGAALNFGINKAKGKIILTLDADSALAKNAIINLVEYFKDPEISGVVGNVKIAENYTLIGLIQRLEYIFGFYFKRTQAVLDSEYIFGGACSAYRSDVFKKIGLFDEVNKTEDIDMSMRLKYHGYKSTYGEDVICYTEGAGDLKGLVNQRLRWKKGRLDTFGRYRTMFFSTDKNHNKFLSWFVLPFALFQELQLLVEPISFALLFGYSIIAVDFVSLTFGLLFISFVYIVTALDNSERFKPEILLIFPASWLLFYILVWVEFMALIKGIYMVLRGKNISWQRWDRQGIYEMS